MFLLNNGKVAFQEDNGKYLSRIAYSNNTVDANNYIQPSKGSADYFSQEISLFALQLTTKLGVEACGI